MSVYCRSYDEKLWDSADVNCVILCEGHGALESLDEKGRPIQSSVPTWR